MTDRFNEEPLLPQDAHEPDAFERMVAAAREVSGYDPGAEDEEHDELAAGRTIRWAGRAILVATLLLAVLNAESIRSWATTLTPNWTSETVSMLADVWAKRTAQAGLDAPRRSIHDAYEGLKAPPRKAAAPR